MVVPNIAIRSNYFRSKQFPEADAGAPFNLTCADTILDINGLGSSQAQFASELVCFEWRYVSGENSLLPVIDQPGLYSLLGFQSFERLSIDGR